jgi:hypothetical protein
VLTGAGLAVLLVLALLIGLSHPAQVSPGASAPASPAGTPMSPDEYQQALTDLDRDLTPLVQAVTATNRYAAASEAARRLQAKVETDAAGLDRIVPPAPVRVAHQHLLKAVHELSTDAGIVADQAHRQLVCLGGTALARWTQSSGAVWLRAATKELASADPAHVYKVGGFMPDLTQDGDRHLGTGTVLKKPGHRGPNEMKISNTGTLDAVLILAPQGSKSATLIVYVGKGATYRGTGIPDATYEMYQVSGKDWDSGAKAFGRYCAFERLEGTIELTSSAREYTEGQLTLVPAESPFNADGVDPDSLPR